VAKKTLKVTKNSCVYFHFLIYFFAKLQNVATKENIAQEQPRSSVSFLALPTKALKDIVFRFIREYKSSLMDFGP
jgi:hypothetical protein